MSSSSPLTVSSGPSVDRQCGVPLQHLKGFGGVSSLLLCPVTQLCAALCSSMDCSTPASSVLHCLPGFTQTHVHWVGDAISSSGVPFSSRPQSFLASGSFPVSQLFTSGGQSIGASASALVLLMNIQSWFPLLTGLISLLFKGLSRVFYFFHQFSAYRSCLQFVKFISISCFNCHVTDTEFLISVSSSPLLVFQNILILYPVILLISVLSKLGNFLHGQ